MNKFSKWLNKISLYLQAAPYNITLYHGTDAKNLKSILKEGLKARTPRSMGNVKLDRGVYLTESLSRAARYARGELNANDWPAILEVKISKPRRVKKLYRDELDRDEMLYDDGAGEFLEKNYLEELEDLVENLFKDPRLSEYKIDFSPFSRFLSNLAAENDPTALDGFPLHKYLINLVRQSAIKNNQNPNRVIRDFKTVLQESDLKAGSTISDSMGDVNYEIKPDGTLFTENYQDIHQVVYPENLHPVTIKAVWLSKLPEHIPGERISIEAMPLPGEVKDLTTHFESVADHAISELEGEDLEKEDFMEIIEEFGSEDIHDWYTKDVQEMFQKVQSAEDLEELKKELTDDFENIREFVYENMEMPQGKVLDFVRLEPTEALKFIQQGIKED